MRVCEMGSLRNGIGEMGTALMKLLIPYCFESRVSLTLQANHTTIFLGSQKLSIYLNDP